MLVNTTTGQITPARCGANPCTYCGPRNAWVTGLAISMTAPQRQVRLSLVGDDWATARNRVKELRKRIRQAGYGWQDCWHREANPQGTGHHAHMYQWGDYVPQNVLQDVCHSVGMGIPWIGGFSASRPVTYGMKSVSYGMKQAARESGEAGLRTFLDWNGGRLVHASRGFWRDGETGTPMGKRDAEKLAQARHSGAPDGTLWVLMREAEWKGTNRGAP